jgi:PKD repeat protein
MKKSIKTITLTLLFTVLLNVAVFTPSVLATENLPTVWVKVYRIQTVDAIETAQEGEADWRYTITVSDGENSVTREFKCPSNSDDIVVDRSDSFTNIKNQDLFVTITLYEDDSTGYEIADVSSSGTTFDGTYNLALNTLGGDETVIDGDYYTTSGSYDQSTQTDENDANLWFAIFDNYDAPVANAGEDQSVSSGEEVNFVGSLSTGSEGATIVKFEWDFENDGVIDAQGINTSYTYNTKGLHTCKLIVTDSIGVTAQDTCQVNVLNKHPMVEFTVSPENPTIQDTVNVTESSYDIDGTISSWFWDFGDGTNSTLQNPAHKYSQKGEWQITLTVTDNDGAKNSSSQTLKVINLQPEASFECNATEIQTETEIQFLDTSIDPENKTLSWFWDFGDGNTSELQTPTHKFTTPGDYNVTLTVKDDEDATSTYTTQLSVTETEAIPLWIIAVIAVAIAAVAFIGLFWWDRRQKSFTEMFTGSEDPANNVP